MLVQKQKFQPSASLENCFNQVLVQKQLFQRSASSENCFNQVIVQKQLFQPSASSENWNSMMYTNMCKCLGVILIH